MSAMFLFRLTRENILKNLSGMPIILLGYLGITQYTYDNTHAFCASKDNLGI